MNKIIAVFDGLNFSDSTKDYALYFSRNRDAHLVGVFLDDRSYTSYKIFELVDDDGVSLKKQTLLDEKDEQTRKHARDKFEKACREAKVNYTVHNDRDLAMDELMHESVYADVMVVGANETMTHYEEKAPTRFIRHALDKVQCPVVILPKVYRAPEKIILLYDGEPSSVYAIKMFSYIFHELKDLPVELLSVNNPNQSLHLHDNRLMKELMRRHFPEAEYVILKGEASTEIPSYVTQQNQNAIVVLGAYGRSKVSRIVDESMADVLIKNVPMPLFIAHY